MRSVDICLLIAVAAKAAPLSGAAIDVEPSVDVDIGDMNGVVARGDDGGILNGNDGLNDNNVDILRRQDLVEADADIPINVDVRGDESQGGILNDNDVLEDNNVDVLKRKGGADVDVLKRQDDGGIVDADVDVDVDVAKRQVPNLVDVDTNADADVGEEA